MYGLLRKLKRSNLLGLHKYINLMYYDPKYVQVLMRNLDYVVVDDCKFYISDQIDSIQRVKGNPWFANIRPTDVVLDIGANIGAITIPLAKIAKKVYAVEPLFADELKRNVKLNDLKNVEIIEYGISCRSGVSYVEFGPRRRTVLMLTLQAIRDRVGLADFIKIDCEGCEWEIKPEELGLPRELRIEFHIRRGHEKQDYKRLNDWYVWLAGKNYKFSLEYGAQPGPCVPFKECILLNASKKESEAKQVRVKASETPNQ